jgi:hypothetical protein
LFSKGCRGDAQCAIRSGALDSDGPEPELIALGNGSDDEDALLPVRESERLRRRGQNRYLKISSFLEVSPEGIRCFIGQFFTIVILSTPPSLEDSVPYSVPVVNITLDFEVA